MIKKTDQDHDHDHDHDPANDNGGTGAVAPAPSGGALAALTALGTTLANVDTSGAGGGGLPMMQFKARENNGTWMVGQRRTVPDADGRWAFNPNSFQWGYVCFDPANNNKRVGEKLVPVSQPMPNPAELPVHEGCKWNEEWSVNVKGLSGPDTGVEAVFKTTTVGGIGAVKGLIEEIRNRVLGRQHGDNVVPVALLRKDSYQHGDYGKTWFPVIEIVDWKSLSGPGPTPTPTPTPDNDEEPRRRRVA